jgi:hypothetical protein
MKRSILFLALIAVLAGGALWLSEQPSASRPVQTSGGDTVLYYQSPMHPWIKSDKPGKCPLCGMNLVPIYADAETGNGLKLNAESITAANVQTTAVGRRPIVRTLRVAGRFQSDGRSPRFQFPAYDRDLEWLKPGQIVVLAVPAAPGKNYQAVILPGDWSSSRTNQILPSNGLVISASISDSEAYRNGNKGGVALNGAYAEGYIKTELPESLAIPRSAVLAADAQPLVYVAITSNRFEPRNITLGRVGDNFAEVIHGLHEGELIVTSGNLTIDAETQISRDANQKPLLP